MFAMAKKHPDETKKLHEKMKELEDGWKRTAADFANYKKRSEEQKSVILEFQKADFMTKITPVLDNFRRAFLHAPEDEFARGIKQIEKQLEDILQAEGLEKIATNPGEKFDCNLHEAISCEPNKKVPADRIIAETESGWKYKNRVLKPTKVRVSKGR
jgi:molecular chaperone GrpE